MVSSGLTLFVLVVALNLTIMTKTTERCEEVRTNKIVCEVGDDVEVTFWCLQARFPAPGDHQRREGTTQSNATQVHKMAVPPGQHPGRNAYWRRNCMMLAGWGAGPGTEQ
jgi:hypothetical protein